MKVSYSSNNSGGGWWLSDDDWLALEKAGWDVEWVYEDEFYKGRLIDGRWLGALAKEASKDFETIKEALEEFEKVTGQSVTDEGCNCCGAPHNFEWDNNCLSGDDLSSHLYGDNGNLTKRELLEKINGKF